MPLTCFKKQGLKAYLYVILEGVWCPLTGYCLRMEAAYQLGLSGNKWKFWAVRWLVRLAWILSESLPRGVHRLIPCPQRPIEIADYLEWISVNRCERRCHCIHRPVAY